METTNRRMLAGLMTEAEIQATAEKWSNVGTENSRERNVAFDLLRLTYHIEQANIPNQLPSYDQANADQFLAHLNALKGEYRLTNKKIEDGLNWLK